MIRFISIVLLTLIKRLIMDFVPEVDKGGNRTLYHLHRGLSLSDRLRLMDTSQINRKQVARSSFSIFVRNRGASLNKQINFKH